MSVRERDPLTGHQTTGHEWDGITELNTRVPRAIWWSIGITHVWALLIWILLPTWPLVHTYTKGLSGIDQQERVEEQVRDAAPRARRLGRRRSSRKSFDQIRADPRLMHVVSETGPVLFADNCSGCHGANAQGGPGFPSLTDRAWLWGGEDETIMETLRVGINAPTSRDAHLADAGLRPRWHPDARADQDRRRLRPVALGQAEVDPVEWPRVRRSSPTTARPATARMPRACRRWAHPI